MFVLHRETGSGEILTVQEISSFLGKLMPRRLCRSPHHEASKWSLCSGSLDSRRMLEN